MSSFKIIGQTKDIRTNTNVLYAQIDISDYLGFVGPNFDRFEIQRKKEKHKGYKRLKRDIENGALIPTITLAVEPSKVERFLKLITDKSFVEITGLLESDPEMLYILDGLQRTYIIQEITESESSFKDGHQILLEIWFEESINHLIYRLIVLNSGQKPMSMRHQIELLFVTMREALKEDLPELKILEEKDEDKRGAAMEFPFDRLVTAYKCFLTKTPEVNKDNIVAERMIEGSILDSDEELLSQNFTEFKKMLKIYCELDTEVFRIYKDREDVLKKYRNWFAENSVINSFFAAVSKYRTNPQRSGHIEAAVSSLLKKLQKSKSGDDPMFLSNYTDIRTEKADPRKYNVGFATRKLLTNAFIDFMRDEGSQDFLEYWLTSSAEL